MQVSTSYFYDSTASAMTRLTSQATTVENQISTGKKLQAPSDDSVSYQRLQLIARQTADANTAGTNLNLASSVLSQADTTLSSITAQIQRASELATSARSGISDSTDNSAIADELDSIRDELLQLGNTVDPRGQPLFGGADGGAAVTANADGTYTYASTDPSAIPIGDGGAVQPSENASRIFSLPGGGDLLSALSTLSAALRGGTDTDAAAATAVDQLSAAGAQVSAVQSSLGARASRVELEQSTVTQSNTDRETERSSLEDTDISTAITSLQKTMTVLEATQASFTKLSSMSLFDYLK
jgi:flagellar hook-associated protein 3 FlgL